MKAGNRVLLTEDLAELTKGQTGTVVVYREKPPWVQFECDVLAVLFDGDKYPAVSRYGKTDKDYITVISKCKEI